MNQSQTKLISTVYAVEDTYVQGGIHADSNFSECKRTRGEMEIKGDEGNLHREVLVRFDLSGLDLTDKKSAFLCVNFTALGGDVLSGNRMYLNVYEVSNDWCAETVTYRNSPSYEGTDPCGRCFVAARCRADVSQAVLRAAAEGRSMISFRLSVSELTASQMYMASVDNKVFYVRPKLEARSSASNYHYEKNLLADKAKNDALWVYAKARYDEWYARYREILAGGDNAYTSVQTDPDTYTQTVTARHGNGSRRTGTFDTRLVSSLKGYEEKIYRTDTYGGVSDTAQHPATGYYYTKKIGDRWWLVDPEGNLCHLHGTTHLKYAYGRSVYQKEAAIRKFGNLENWADAAVRFAKYDLGFNASFSISPQVLGVADGLPHLYYTKGLNHYASHGGATIPNGGGVPNFVGGSMPVFDPAFEDFMDDLSKKAAEECGDNPFMVGYITDNEMAVDDRMLASCLSLDPTVPGGLYSYVCAWTWYKNITGEENPAVEDIDLYSEKLGVDLYDLFKGYVYDRYYCVCRTALRRYDSNRLYFGNRYLISAKKWEWTMRFTGYWCDVMCINYYHVWEIPTAREEKEGLPTLDQLGAWLGIPFIVTEFYAKGNDAVNTRGEHFGNNQGAGWVVETQRERGYFYQNYTLKLLQCQHCVGWMQFQFIDNDPTDPLGLPVASDTNKGVVDSNHDFTVYRDYAEQIAEINKNCYALIEYFDGEKYFS